MLVKVLLLDGSAAFSGMGCERSEGAGVEFEATAGGGMEGTKGGTGGTIGGASGTTVGSKIGRMVCRVIDGLGLAAVGKVGLGFSSETGDPCEPCTGDDGMEDGSLCTPDKRLVEGRRDTYGRDPELGLATAVEDVPSSAKFGGKEELIRSADISDACMTSVMSGRGSIEGGVVTVSDS